MNPLNRALATLAKLKTTNSIKDKEAILLTEVDNYHLQTLLEANLNPYKLFYIKKIPEYNKARPLNDLSSWKHFIQLLADLENRVYTGNEAIERTVGVLASVDNEELEQVFKDVLFKAAIGVGVSTVNKVWPNLIPTFDVMLAPSKLANVTNISYPTYITPKLDGFRCVCLPLGGQITLWSRSGKIFGNKQLISHFKALQNVKDVVLDGELYSHELSFEKLVSVLTTEDAEIPKDLKFTVFDCIPLKDWNNKSCKLRYEQRLKLLRETLNDQVADYKKVVDIETTKVDNAKDLVDIYKKHLQSGFEGSIIRSIDGLYHWKRVTLRSGEMLKLKPMETIDVTVKSLYEAEGNFVGLAGGIEFDFNNHTVRCGSGFTIDHRKEMAASPSKFVGKVAEIKYMEQTEAGSLRHPVFIRWRMDK